MNNLIDNIVSGNYTEANRIFESSIELIRERKLYEEKRRMAADLDEVFGGLSPEEIAIRKKAGYRKAADVLGDPRDKIKKKIILPEPQKKKIAEATEKSTAGIRGAMQSDDPKVAAAAAKKQRIYRAALALSGRKGLGGKAAPRASFVSKTTTPEKKVPEKKVELPKDKKTPWLKRNVNTLLGREPDYTKTPDKRGGRAGKAVRGAGKIAGSAIGAIAGEIASSLGESEN